MTGVRLRGEDIRKYILENIDKSGADVAKQAAAHFGITRQAVNKHLQRAELRRSIDDDVRLLGKLPLRRAQLPVAFRLEHRVANINQHGDVIAEHLLPTPRRFSSGTPYARFVSLRIQSSSIFTYSKSRWENRKAEAVVIALHQDEAASDK